MLSMERYQYIINYLEENGNSTRKELAELLNVTTMTIGRDFKKLEEKGLLIQTHGGAVLPGFLMEERKYERKKEEHREIKRQIAKRIFQKICSNMTIILDAGTTTYELASLLKNSSLKNICVITNDLYIALELYQKKEIKVLLLGGEVLSETGSTATIFSLQQIEGYNADIAFLGVSSISETFDLTVPTEVKAFLKRTMMKISKESILLVDSSKFQKKKLYKFANLKNFDYIVTDYIFSKEEIEKYHLKKKVINIK